jgi:hypothetical protein
LICRSREDLLDDLLTMGVPKDDKCQPHDCGSDR